MSEATTITCPGCGQRVRAIDGAAKVHYASVAATRPCVGSWKRTCPGCSGLLDAHGKHVGLDDVEIAASSLRCDRLAGP